MLPISGECFPLSQGRSTRILISKYQLRIKLKLKGGRSTATGEKKKHSHERVAPALFFHDRSDHQGPRRVPKLLVLRGLTRLQYL